jgi:hypothetical protein
VLSRDKKGYTVEINPPYVVLPSEESQENIGNIPKVNNAPSLALRPVPPAGAFIISSLYGTGSGSRLSLLNMLLTVSCISTSFHSGTGLIRYESGIQKIYLKRGSNRIA